MPLFVNENEHPIRVAVDPTGAQLPRILPGQIVQASGGYADNLGSTPGVREASAEEYESYLAELGDPNTADLGASRTRPRQLVAQARTAIGYATVVGPLQRVVGDDQAPFGPPSGTITTRQAVAREANEAGDQRTRMAFADHDALDPVEGLTEERENPLDATIRTSPAIHNTQADNFVAAEAAADALINEDTPAQQLVDPRGDGLNVGGGADTEPVSGDYRKANKVQLQAEAARRGVEPEGDTKQDLINALEADDAAQGSQA